MKRRIQLICFVLFCLAGTALLLNQISYNPAFSIVDAFSGATKHARSRKTAAHAGEKTWQYEAADLMLRQPELYDEKQVEADGTVYVVLQKKALDKPLVILSNQENPAYEQAVQQVKNKYEQQGYQVQLKEGSEIMMMSLAHAGRFDVMVLRKGESA